MAQIFGIPDQAIIAALQPFQGHWNGLTFGENTEYHLGAMENLLAYESRVSDTPIPQGDGDMVIGRWAAGRVVTLPFTVLGDAGHDEAQHVWLAAFDADDPYAEDWLVWRDHFGAHLARGRVVRRRVEQTPMAARTRAAPAIVELKLADPRIYDGDAGVQTAFVPFGTGDQGGFNLPADLPLDMAAADPGTVVVANSGNTAVAPLIRISNPVGAGSDVTELELFNITTGVTFHIITDIVEGQELTVDMDALIRRAPGPHVHIDGTSRYGGWQHPRQTWTLARGNNVIDADHTGGAPVVRLDWLQPTL